MAYKFFIVGSSGQIRSFDGANWVDLSPPEYSSYDFFDIWGSTIHDLWVVGGKLNDPLIIHSTDKGKTWVSCSYEPGNYPPANSFDQITGYSKNVGETKEKKILLTARNTGSHQDIYQIENDNVIKYHSTLEDEIDGRIDNQALYAIDENNIYAITNHGLSKDLYFYDGNSWTNYNSVISDAQGIWSDGPDEVYVCGANMSMLQVWKGTRNEWTNVYEGIFENFTIGGLADCTKPIVGSAISHRIWVAGYDFGKFRASFLFGTNRGQNWEVVNFSRDQRLCEAAYVSYGSDKVLLWGHQPSGGERGPMFIGSGLGISWLYEGNASTPRVEHNGYFFYDGSRWEESTIPGTDYIWYGGIGILDHGPITKNEFWTPRGGLGNVGDYMLTGMPYVTGSIIHGGDLNHGEIKVEFPRVTKKIKIKNNSIHSTLVHLDSRENSDVINGRHYFTIFGRKETEFQMRTKQIYLSMANSTKTGSCEITAQLTHIDASDMHPLTGSGING